MRRLRKVGSGNDAFGSDGGRDRLPHGGDCREQRRRKDHCHCPRKGHGFTRSADIFTIKFGRGRGFSKRLKSKDKERGARDGQSLQAPQCKTGGEKTKKGASLNEKIETSTGRVSYKNHLEEARVKKTTEGSYPREGGEGKLKSTRAYSFMRAHREITSRKKKVSEHNHGDEKSVHKINTNCSGQLLRKTETDRITRTE